MDRRGLVGCRRHSSDITAVSVPTDADQAGGKSGLGGPSAHALLTQTAPDEKSEAEQSPFLGRNPRSEQ